MRITRKQLIAAIEADGYKQATGYLWKDDDKGNIENACALGQAYLNMGVTINWSGSESSTDLRVVSNLNDSGKTLKQIVRALNKLWKETLNQEVDVEFMAEDWADQYKNYQGVKVRVY